MGKNAGTYGADVAGSDVLAGVERMEVPSRERPELGVHTGSHGMEGMVRDDSHK